MTVFEFLKSCRLRLSDPDQETWEDHEMLDYYKEAQDTFARRTLVFLASDDTTETLATAKITLSGTTGQVDSVTVNGISQIAAPVVFSGNLATTATALAAALNASTATTSYTAVSSGSDIVLSAKTSTGTSPNGYVVKVGISGGLAAAITNFAGGRSMTRLYLKKGQQRYELNPEVIDVYGGVMFYTDGDSIKRKAANGLSFPSYGTAIGKPNRFVHDDSASVRFDYIPDADYTVDFTVARMPRNTVTISSMNRVNVEVPERYQSKMYLGILASAYQKLRYGEMISSVKANRYELLWENFLSDVAFIEAGRGSEFIPQLSFNQVGV